MFSNELTKRERYDYFLIWGHGLHLKEKIIKIIDQNKFIDILKIIKHEPITTQALINSIYSYDYAPIKHLRAKTRYLLKCPKKVIFIFVKNNNSQEFYQGKNEFRHIESLTIKKIKEDIRNKFNEYKNNIRTENHIIHASDNEIQTDHILKYLGFKEGINHLKRKPNPIITSPYHLTKFNKFTIKKINIDKLQCSIITGKIKKIKKVICNIEETPHYKALKGNKEKYIKYIKKYGGIYLTDNHSLDNFLKLKKNFKYPYYKNNLNYILVKSINKNKFLIQDGVHRASILKYKKINNILVAIINS